MRINKKLFPPWTVPIFLLLLAFINFGLHCNSVGFYFDDLPFLWLTKLRGISSITELDPGRPLSGWLLMLGVRIFGYKPLYWQAFSAFGRWLSAVGLWWMVLQLYPKRVYTATLISVIFLVYPGFGHQYIPVNSSRHIYPYALTVVSMGFMLLGVRSSCLRRWLFVLISFILAAVSMLTTDYYYGLELLRPVLIWVVLSEKFKNLKQRFIETIKIWSPFLLLVFVFYLRRSLHKEYYQVGIFGSLLEGGLLSSLFILSQTIFQDLIEVSLIAWERVVQIQELISLDTPSDKLFTLFFFVAFFLTVIYFLKLKVTKLYNQDSYSIKSNIQMAFVGAWALLVAGLPMWLIPLLIRLDFPENRFTLPLALGVSILFVSVLKLFVKNRAKQIIIVGVAIGFATSSHFQLAKSFKTERHLQKEFIWQMVWRAPKIDSGTAIIIQDHPFNYTDDEGLTGLVNWIYAPDNSSPDLPYVLIGNQPEYFAEDDKIIRVSLDTFFHGSKNQSLWVHYSPPGCLHVLDANYDKQIWIYPGSIYEQASFSNVSYIDTSATFPGMEEDVLNILGPEPNHGWCYFYQMANRARQNKDWDTIVMLGEEANALDLRYYQPIEALPFIEGYARDRRWEQANNLTKDVLANTRSLQVPLCSIWEEAEREMVLDNKDQDHIQQLKSSIGCQQN